MNEIYSDPPSLWTQPKVKALENLVLAQDHRLLLRLSFVAHKLFKRRYNWDVHDTASLYTRLQSISTRLQLVIHGCMEIALKQQLSRFNWVAYFRY
jgi:hypothetical protein